MRWLLVLICVLFGGSVDFIAPPQQPHTIPDYAQHATLDVWQHSMPVGRLTSANGQRLVEEHEEEGLHVAKASQILWVVPALAASPNLPMSDKFVREKTHYPPPEA